MNCWHIRTTSWIKKEREEEKKTKLCISFAFFLLLNICIDVLVNNISPPLLNIFLLSLHFLCILMSRCMKDLFA